MSDSAPNSQHERSWLRKLAGRFVVLDGPDGSGKSTLVESLQCACSDEGVPVCVVREPGGTQVGEEIRSILLDHKHGDMSLRCEALLYMASRAQLVEHRIRPALKRGEFVLADRFVSSTLAYQGAGGGLTADEIQAVARVACGDVSPDLVVILDVDAATAASRLGPVPDRIEARSADFHQRVRQGFLDQAKRRPQTFAVLDAAQSRHDVESALLTLLRDRLGSDAL